MSGREPHTSGAPAAARALTAHSSASQISFSLPNLHHWLVDLSAFGMTNDNKIYSAPTEPQGLIEATIQRSTASGGS